MAAPGKKKGKKGKTTLSLNEFLSKDGDGSSVVGSSYVMQSKSVNSWADETDDMENDLGGSNPSWPDADVYNKPIDRTKLPTAPRSSCPVDIDRSTLPTVPPYTAFLGNLPYDVDKEDIFDFFKDYKVSEVRLPRDGGGESGRLKGFGYAEFDDVNSLIDALGMNNEPLRNRRIRVDIAGQQEGGERGGMGRDEGPDRTEGDWRRGPDEGPSGPPPRDDRYRDNQGFSRNSYDRPDDRYSRSNDYDRSGGRSRGGGYNDYGSDRGFSRDDRGFGGDRGGGGFQDRGRYDDAGGRGGGFGSGFRGERNESEGDWRKGGDERRNDFGGGGGSDRRDDRGGYDRGRYERRDGFGSDRRDGGYDRGGQSSYNRRDDQSSYNRRDDQYGNEPPRADAPPRDAAPKERRRLQLQPRSQPVDKDKTVVASPAPAAAASSSSSSIFGGAKPVDTAAKEREIEQRLVKEKLQEEDKIELERQEERQDSWRDIRQRRDSDRSDEGRGSTSSRTRHSSSGSASGRGGPKPVMRTRKDSERSVENDNVFKEDKGPESPKQTDDPKKVVPAPLPKDNPWQKPRSHRSSTSDTESRPRDSPGSTPPRDSLSSAARKELVDAPAPVENIWAKRAAIRTETSPTSPPASSGGRRQDDGGRRRGSSGDQPRDDKNRNRDLRDRQKDEHHGSDGHKQEKRKSQEPREMPKYEEPPPPTWSQPSKFSTLMDDEGDEGDEKENASN